MGVSIPVLGVPGVLGGGGLTPAEQLYAYLATLGTPTLDLRFDETSGNLINYGSDSSAVGVNTDVDQAQVGQLGAGQAYNYNGTSSYTVITNANLANTKALTTQRWMALVKFDTVASHAVFTFGLLAATGQRFLVLNADGRILSQVEATGNDAFAQTNTSIYEADKWFLIFVDYDDAITRKIRLYYADATTDVTDITLVSSQTAATGTVEVPSADLTLGKWPNNSYYTNGQFDMVRVESGLWTETIMSNIRALVFP